MFRQGVTDNLKELRRNDTRLGTSRPGPMSWGPGDGHARFYAADGSTVLFEAVGGSGASVVSRGALTGLTGLLDGIRDLDDDQDGRLDGHDTTLASHDTRITNEVADRKSADLALHGRVNTEADQRKAADSALSSRVSTAKSRADSAHSNAATAQARADSAWTRAGTALANAATAQARADNAHTRIDGLNYASPGDIATLSNRIQALRSEVHHWMNQARASNPDLPPPIPN